MKIEEIKSLCVELEIRPNKDLGQNFLIDSHVCNKIVSKAFEKEFPINIEIGPGLGSLTRLLSPKISNLQLIELDKKLSEYWTSQGYFVHHEDAAKFDWKKHIKTNCQIVSNLPYQISSILVINLSLVQEVDRMILMFQKEVAQRIRAQPKNKEYGMLSVLAQTYWDIEKLVDVSPRAFYPPPKIDSRVLVFNRKDGTKEFGIKFLNFLKAAFSQRRKFLSKNISSYLRGLDNKEWLKLFSDLGIPEKARAEELTVLQFEKLFKELEHVD
jgi:16S rRNA (adenine1518-N6/adenine1519-N6)-dimethyltransferase